MCILFIAIGQHDHYPLIIAANRDEYHARPSEPMHYWPDQPGILAGRDQLAGGAWFGVNSQGRIAAVANRHGGGGGGVRSRGDLTARFLRNAESTESYREFLDAEHRDFRPFHLVYGDADKLYCFSGGPPSRPLGRGFHSISNGALDDPWPKMARGVSLLKAQISSSRAIDREELVQVMKDQSTPDGEPPPDSATAREKYLSPIFITGPDYGTRTTTLLLGTQEGFDIDEYNYSPDGVELDRRRYSVCV